VACGVIVGPGPGQGDRSGDDARRERDREDRYREHGTQDNRERNGNLRVGDQPGGDRQDNRGGEYLGCPRLVRRAGVGS